MRGGAVVTVDGEVYGTYSLAKDQTTEIQDGNRLRIQNGQRRWRQTVRISSYYSTPEGNPRTGESIICPLESGCSEWETEAVKRVNWMES